MPWVRFVAPFDWRVSPRQFIAYEAGMVLLVTTACARAAKAAGAAESAVKPKGESDAQSRTVA